MPDQREEARPRVLGEHVRPVLTESLCGFLIGESLGTGPQPLADTHGIRCCGVDQGLRDMDTLLVVPYSGDEVLWNHVAPHCTAAAQQSIAVMPVV